VMMPRGRYPAILALALVVGLTALVVYIRIGRQFDTPEQFSAQLNRVDLLISEGRQETALNRLASLRKRAVSVRDFLSIAKRELALQASKSALATLDLGSQTFPVNQEMAALATYILMDLDRYQEAADRSSFLLSGSWSAIAAAAALSTSVDPLTVSSAVYRAAAEVTGYPFYYRNAIVTAARKGELAQALLHFKEWRYRLPDDVLLGVILAYDNKQWQYLLELAEFEARYLTRIYLAAAHAAYLLGDIPRAISLWDTIILNDPEQVLALYNRAYISEDFALKKASLQKALNLNPSFWPALNQYISLFLTYTDSSEAFSPVTARLKEMGWETLEMERRRGYARITEQEIVAAIQAAVVSGTGDGAGRVQIEALRFSLSQGNDRLRTIGKIWQLLEKYPSDPDILEYAVWFFLESADPDAAAFLLDRLDSLSVSRPWVSDFYHGIFYTLQGKFKDARLRFDSVASDHRNAWRALANSARIYQIQGNTSAAIETFSLATELTPEPSIKSLLFYEVAHILAEARERQRATVIAGYAVELDPENYKAVSLLRELENR